jgi:hypothetical protein
VCRWLIRGMALESGETEKVWVNRLGVILSRDEMRRDMAISAAASIIFLIAAIWWWRFWRKHM